MKDNSKKFIVILISILVGLLTATSFYSRNINNDLGNIINDVLSIEELKEIKENVETTEIVEQSIVDEQSLEYQETEAEGFESQGEIAYNGADNTNLNITLGEKIGLTYYSQIDSRWKNNLYTSVGDTSQTIGSSGCGPTSASMVVTSIKGIITPDTMADLYVRYGFRSSNNGTYWSAFRWTADVFDIEYQETYYLNTAVELVRNNNYVIVGCRKWLIYYRWSFHCNSTV